MLAFSNDCFYFTAALFLDFEVWMSSFSETPRKDITGTKLLVCVCEVFFLNSSLVFSMPLEENTILKSVFGSDNAFWAFCVFEVEGGNFLHTNL